MDAATHNLMPGDVVCADRGARLETLLGSCVAVVLTDRHRTVGAMCHIVHSGTSTPSHGKPASDADTAVDAMYALMRSRGFTPALCDAFVYGGGNMFPQLVDGTHVGERNALHVLNRLRTDHINVLHRDLGGRAYRRLGWTIGPDDPEVTAVPV